MTQPFFSAVGEHLWYKVLLQWVSMITDLNLLIRRENCVYWSGGGISMNTVTEDDCHCKTTLSIVSLRSVWKVEFVLQVCLNCFIAPDMSELAECLG